MSVIQRLEETFSADEYPAITTLLPEGVSAAKEAVSEQPDLTNALMDEVDRVDVAEAAGQAPEVVDEVQRLLWAVHSEKVERFDVLASAVTASVQVNYRATDSPLEGHLCTDSSARTLTGGPSTVEGGDLLLTGSSDVLAGLLTGSTDPVKAYERSRIEVEGSLSDARSVAASLRKVTRRL